MMNQLSCLLWAAPFTGSVTPWYGNPFQYLRLGYKSIILLQNGFYTQGQNFEQTSSLTSSKSDVIIFVYFSTVDALSQIVKIIIETKA